jgi:hypothetical protein
MRMKIAQVKPARGGSRHQHKNEPKNVAAIKNAHNGRPFSGFPRSSENFLEVTLNLGVWNVLHDRLISGGGTKIPAGALSWKIFPDYKVKRVFTLGQTI